jgi:enediyne biosynthesis protein E4
MNWNWLLLASWILSGVGCAGRPPSEEVAPPPVAPASPPWFEETTSAAGLDFLHDAGPARGYFMPQSMGSGAALFDFDNDGRLDIYLLQGAGPDSESRNALFRQQEDGAFRDVSEGSGLDIPGYHTGVAIGDVDNDGLRDVLVVQYGGLRLFRNEGEGRFTDISREAGIDSTLWGASACFLDFDRDGWLDFVVANYIAYDPSKPCYDTQGRRDFCHPSHFPPLPATLFRNLGADGEGAPVRFENVTASSGLASQPGTGLGVVSADFDGDGWIDIFVANDGRANHLWINQRDGTFREEAIVRGIATDALGNAPANMGIALGDVDRDGLFDVFVSHLTRETHTLWRQAPRGMFRDRSADAGLLAAATRGTGFGAVLADFDLDGFLDAAVVNGRVSREGSAGGDASGYWGPYAEKNQLFRNDGAGRLLDISHENPALCGAPGVYRGLACGDIDNDGRLDLLVTATAGPARLYRNIAEPRGRWLIVEAIDPALRRDAYGAEIVVRAGDESWRRWINPGYSYQCSNDPRAHFGLGRTDAIDSIEVSWPDGSSEKFPGGETNRAVVLRRGEGEVE